MAFLAAFAIVLGEAAFALDGLAHADQCGKAQSIAAVCPVCDLDTSTTAPLRPCRSTGALTPLPSVAHASCTRGADVNCGVLRADPASPRAPPLHA